jgi:Uma2 family endonuclease
MNVKYAVSYLTEDEYLESEKTREIKHEYVDGEIYAMVGASRSHNIISHTISRLFGNHLADTRCNVFASDMKVKIETQNSSKFFYPDVLVTCDDENGHDYYTDKPIIIVEVLSKATRQIDKTFKLNAYKTLPSLQEYVLIEQDFVEIEVCRRSNSWLSERYFLGDSVTFESIGLTLSVEAIYHRVPNQDVLEYLAAKMQKTEQK